MARSSIRWGLAARLTLALPVVLFGLGALAVALGPGTATTYPGHSILAAVLAAIAGFALVLAALVLSASDSPRLISALTLLAAVTWFAPVWVGWEGGPPLARSLAMLVVAFTAPLLLHVVLAYPGGRAQPKLARALVAAAYVVIGLVTVGLALVRNPFFDPDCWANCTDNSFLVHSVPGVARVLETAGRWFTVAIAAAFATLCVWRLATNSGPARRALLPVAAPGMLFAAGVAGHSIALDRIVPEDPSHPVFFSTFILTATAVTLLAAGLLWGSLRRTLQRRAVARIVTSLGAAAPAGALEPALAQAVGDPSLQIAYWLPRAQHFVDSQGHQVVEPGDAPGRAITALVRDERLVALVSHAAGLPGIEPKVGPAVRLALENERLHAEGLAQLDELRASRARIVETGDAERRRLERDLHDGAQQRLLAVSYDVRLARAQAQADGDTRPASQLTAALADLQAALDELRTLAHGIYPAILGEAGLAAAVSTLADTAPLRVELRDVTGERYPPAVETAAYILVLEALEDAATRGATSAAVSAVRAHQQLTVAVEDDGAERTSAMVQLDDRVGALGGHVEVGPITLKAMIPCA
ncbi:MAG: histidine kinase [Chloroflexota bacterium]|nr:histidine kinase [Chloroflexota bacterium]